MEWKFDRPNNAKRRLLTNDVGLGVAIKTLKARHRHYAFTVFMSPPSPIKQELPWLKEEADENGAGPLDFDFSIEELMAPGNSAGIDNTSNPHFNRLLKKYPIDNHPQFPGKRIYHNGTGFFELTDVRLRVWAVAMAKGVATENDAPVSNHFAKNQTIRLPHAAPPALAPMTAFPNPSTSSDVLQLILPALQALTHANHAPYGLLPPYYPHQYPPPPFGAVVPAPPVPPAAVQRPPSPPVVLPCTISLDEYCDRYQINADDRRVLVELGYEPGDNGIKELDKEVWDAVKVTPLAKGRILRQHTAFIKDVIAGLWN
ncbi:hypothetical protein B0H14DRAFT_3441023 [Mycena olivaceomarginata]|nr:hypothetical protein B0H14DRAFT_3441023 [Mycena olivaceomarginata]